MNNINDRSNFYSNMTISCELGTVIETLDWYLDEPKPKAKIYIPILMPLENGDTASTQKNSVNMEGGSSISGSNTTYTTSNYITLDIPTYLFPEPKTISLPGGVTRKCSTIPKGTEVIITFIGGYIKLDMIRVISISL